MQNETELDFFNLTKDQHAAITEMVKGFCQQEDEALIKECEDEYYASQEKLCKVLAHKRGWIPKMRPETRAMIKYKPEREYCNCIWCLYLKILVCGVILFWIVNGCPFMFFWEKI